MKPSSIAASMILIAVFSAAPAVAAEGSDVKRETAVVQADIRAMSDALFAGDSETILRYTYPKVIETFGGRERLAAFYSTAAGSQKQMGITRESLTFPAPLEFLDGKNGRRFVVAPSRSVIGNKDGRGAVTGFHLGVKEKDAQEWKYIPGQFVKPQTLPAMLPDFPPGHPWPPQGHEKLPLHVPGAE